MTALAAGHAYVLRDSSLLFGATDFANAATEATIVPTTEVQTLTTLVPDGVYVDNGATTWVLLLAGVSDWKTGGFAKYLIDHSGEQVEVVLTPRKGADEPTATFTVTCQPVSFGGKAGNFNTFDTINLSVSGAPVFSETGS